MERLNDVLLKLSPYFSHQTPSLFVFKTPLNSHFQSKIKIHHRDKNNTTNQKNHLKQNKQISKLVKETMALKKSLSASLLSPFLIICLTALLTGPVSVGSRRLLENVTPEIPTLPELPKPEMPKLPEFPKLELPEIQKPELPKMPEIPKPELPKMPEVSTPELPKMPEIHIPEVPKLELPKIPEVLKPELPKLPEIPKFDVPKLPELPKPEETKVPAFTVPKFP